MTEMNRPRNFTQTDLTYNEYLKIPEMLALQTPLSKPAHHDELLFIIIHQAYELWFKLVLHELDQAQQLMNKNEPLRAHKFVQRSVEIMKLLLQQIHILETMAPADFLEFRDRLSPASGFQSLQFREVEFLAGIKDEHYLVHFKDREKEKGNIDDLSALKKRLQNPHLRESFYKLLKEQGFQLDFMACSAVEDLEQKLPNGAEARSGVEEKNQVITALKEIYQKPDAHLAIYLLAESLVSLDQSLALWRFHHMKVVERIIGFKMGTGGSSGVGYLRSTTQKKCYPWLWEVRSHLELKK